MFGLYFGNYLVEKNIISCSQYEDIMRQHQQTRVKLGLIAVSEKLLSSKQAEEINDIQKTKDKRFGDIAIEKGFLLEEEVTYLLNMQGNPYLQFVQVCTENNILSLLEIETYLEQFRLDNSLSKSELDAIKSGDIDRIIPVFVDIDEAFVGECISLVLRNIVRFINNNMIINKLCKIKEYTFNTLAFQKLVGDHELFVGLAGKNTELLQIANPFAKENFPELNEDAYDAVCEFINCTNGLFASKLSHEGTYMDMTPPLFYSNKTIFSEKDFCLVPIILNGEQVDLIVAIDNQLDIK